MINNINQMFTIPQKKKPHTQKIKIKNKIGNMQDIA